MEQRSAAPVPERCAVTPPDLPTDLPADLAAELWLLDSASLPVGPSDLRCLDATELRRSERFVRDADRTCYLAAHVALRRVLGRRLAVAPEALVFERAPCPGCAEPHGRPRLAGSGAPHFSLSHGGGTVLIGLAAVPVGVDVEPVPAAESAEVLSAVLHPAERAELVAVPPADRPGVFARLWTRKEAYLKGLGIGLGRPPAADYLGGDRDRHPGGWTVTDLPAGPRYAAAVALAAPAGGRAAPPHLRLHHALDGPAGAVAAGLS
ncbi:4'-phosphopantetheinyl transferase family protein [Kitasatospora sp. NBC_00458]|uniref:4'-phosphopantetheinyl transferase family protein n=1 Tax=Kitasatospora sp. NBC_00458 TaxID=2903568 RepID=UPI002E1954FF